MTAHRDEPLLDEAVIDQLRQDITDELMPEMLEKFVLEASRRAQDVANAGARSSIDELEAEAHTLKSCAGTFGAARLHALARDIEAACRQGNRATAENLAERVREVHEDTLRAYRKRFSFLQDTHGDG